MYSYRDLLPLLFVVFGVIGKMPAIHENESAGIFVRCDCLQIGNGVDHRS